MTQTRIEPAGAADLPFLEAMLVEAAAWRDPESADPSALLAEPHVARYLSDWGREGDTALVAIDEEEGPVGAAWFRSFTVDEPGYGFIDELTPELSIAVRAGARGRGIGTVLLGSLLDEAKRQGFIALSLSVEDDNPATRLYERLGFHTVASAGGTSTMVRSFP